MWSSIFTAGFPLHYTEEVRHALVTGQPTVALETTIITHGMPHPHNLTSVCEVIFLYFIVLFIYTEKSFVFVGHLILCTLYFMGWATHEFKIPTKNFKKETFYFLKLKIYKFKCPSSSNHKVTLYVPMNLNDFTVNL